MPDIDELLHRLRWPHYYVDYHAGKTSSEIHEEVVAITEAATVDLKLLIQQEKLKAQIELAKMYAAIGENDILWGANGLPPEVLGIFSHLKPSTADIPRGKKPFMEFVITELQSQLTKLTGQEGE